MQHLQVCVTLKRMMNVGSKKEREAVFDGKVDNCGGKTNQ